MQGTLGSGKTNLTKGIALGLGIKEEITSPTYTIINEYRRSGSPTLFHIDAYRLNDETDFENTGGLELIFSDGISVIEWSEKIIKSLPEKKITVSIQITESQSRQIHINGLENFN